MNKLEKLKGICVRGGKHGAELIEVFMDAGAAGSLRDGSAENGFYYLEDNHITGVCPKAVDLNEITLDELKEIVYEVDWENPPKYVKSRKNDVVVKVECGEDDNMFSGTCVASGKNKITKKGQFYRNWYKSYFRLLTSSELSALEKELEGEKKVDVIAGVDFGGLIEALNSLKIKKQTPIDRTIYQRLRILGFKKKEFQDDAFFDKNGYTPFQMRKKIDKKTFLVWDKTEPNNEEILFICDGVIMTKSTVDAVELTLGKLYKQS